MAEKIGSFLYQNGMFYEEPLQQMKLMGIFSKNRYEWMLVDIACILYGFTSVPLYETLGIENLQYCIEHSGITTLFVTAGTLNNILSLKSIAKLQNIISF
jgi:long-chain acyl-CoA synthetase